MKKTFTVLMWCGVVADIAAAAGWGIYALLINYVLPAESTDLGTGLGHALTLILLVVLGVGSAPFAIAEIVGAIGFSAKLKSGAFVKGFAITAIVPCLVMAIVQVVEGILIQYMPATVVMFVFAALNVALFAVGIAAIKLNGKT